MARNDRMATHRSRTRRRPRPRIPSVFHVGRLLDSPAITPAPRTCWHGCDFSRRLHTKILRNSPSVHPSRTRTTASTRTIGGLALLPFELLLNVLYKAPDTLFCAFSPGNAITHLLDRRNQRNEAHTRCRQTADMFRENGNTETRSDVLDSGSRPVDFLHYFWDKAGPFTHSCNQ